MLRVYRRRLGFHERMSQSPWNQSNPAKSPADLPRTVAGPVIALVVVLSALVAGGLAWWLQSARVEAKERERAEAATELAALSTRVQKAESEAAEGVLRVKQAEAAAQASNKEAADGMTQLDTVRRESTAVRTERDQVRSQFTVMQNEFDRMKAADLDPGVLSVMDLSKVFAATTQVRGVVDVQVTGSAVAGFDQTAVTGMLQEALQAEGLAVGAQSPFKVAVFVSLGKEQPRRSLGVMVLLLRSMKVPGELGSREVAVWGQQRTSAVSDAEATGQVKGLLGELSKQLSISVGVKQRATVPAATPPVAPPASEPPVTAPPASEPPVESPPVESPPVNAPSVDANSVDTSPNAH